MYAEYYAPNLWDRWRNMAVRRWPNWRHNWRTRRGRQGSCIQGRLCSLCVVLAATDFSRSAKLVCNHIILTQRVQCHWFCFGLAVTNCLFDCKTIILISPCNKVIGLLVTQQALLPIDPSTASSGVAHSPVEVLLRRGRHFSSPQLMISLDSLFHTLSDDCVLTFWCATPVGRHYY